jgi:hypothetical protein
MKKLAELLLFFENNVNASNKQNVNISKASVGWHIAHSIKVIINVSDAINNSKPEFFKPKFSLLKSLILITGKIPRGKAKAPKSTAPNEDITIALLQNEIKTAKEKLSQLVLNDSSKYFTHPIFGDLKLKKAVKFLNIHTYHHYKLISDILKN